MVRDSECYSSYQQQKASKTKLMEQNQRDWRKNKRRMLRVYANEIYIKLRTSVIFIFQGG